MFEDSKEVNRIRKSKNSQHNDKKENKCQKDKQRSTKHYTEKQRSSNTNPTKSSNGGFRSF